jgi:predicted DNA-binding protein
MVMEKRIEIKMNKETKIKLDKLSQLPEFENNKSQVIRSAIHYYYNKRLSEVKRK